MLRPLPASSDHFDRRHNFSAYCTNASLVLTSFRHQRQLDHTGRAPQPERRLSEGEGVGGYMNVKELH